MSLVEIRQNLRTIERTLGNIYEKILGQIRSDPLYPINYEVIKGKYEKKVYDSTRKAVEDIYRQGLQRVERKLNTTTFISSNDIAQIRKITDDNITRFWIRVRKEFERENLRDYQINLEERTPSSVKPELNTRAALVGLATVIVTSGYAISQLTKTKELKQEKIIETIQRKQVVRWVTKLDERVCPLCDLLHGQIWDIDDPSIPTPGLNGPNGTHSNCRCELEILEEEI
ncbi:MAG: hypothetical protein CV087_08855 [Candidatus Brocadia sp. WS118]|nr:MAG: hypothetical protein CV087_08855 [Candidatus Brocadia sp. WS118]